jgi:hypothetical protein
MLISSYYTSNALIKNVFADCYVLAEYTRYAYQDAYIVKTYTIKAVYTLSTLKNNEVIYLASLDGSVSSVINLDFLQNLKLQKPAITISPIDVSLSKVENTLVVVFANWKSNSKKTTIEIYAPDGRLIFSEELSDPNKATVYFDMSTFNYTSNDLFKVVAKTILEDGNTIEISKYFNLEGRIGVLHPSVAIVGSILSLLFMFTAFAVSKVFSIFGLLGVVIALIILSLAPLTPTILFLYGIVTIVGVYIGITFISEYKEFVR